MKARRLSSVQRARGALLVDKTSGTLLALAVMAPLGLEAALLCLVGAFAQFVGLSPFDSGLAHHRRSAVAFAEAIGELLEDPERRSRMGDTGRRRVFDGLDPEFLVRRYEEVHETAVTWHPDGRPAGNPHG